MEISSQKTLFENNNSSLEIDVKIVKYTSHHEK